MKTSDLATPLESHDAISERAAEFLTRRRDKEWSDADQAELDAWLAESVLHEVAYLRVEEGTARADQLAGLNAMEFKRSGSGSIGNFRFRGLFFPFLAAASVAVAALWGPSLVASWFAPPDRTDSTDIGGRTLLSFSDHTEIELNTATAVRLRMTSKERTVWLEKGEAWFRVAHDAAHPFSVIVGTHRITDLGTEFLIRRDGDAVDVTLLKGRAAVSSEGLQTATLIPDEEAMATPTALSVTRKTPQELADELAWRQGLLVFRKTPLADVVREFNRYNTTKLEVDDPVAASETVTADLRTDDYETFLHIAESVMNLRVDRSGNVIRISREARPEAKDGTKKAAHVRRSP
jgi:transmembrane sensor